MIFAKIAFNLILDIQSVNLDAIMAGALTERGASANPNLERAVGLFGIDQGTVDEIAGWGWRITSEGSCGLKLSPPITDSSRKPFQVVLETGSEGKTARVVPIDETVSEIGLLANHGYHHDIRDPKVGVAVDAKGNPWIKMEGPDFEDNLGGRMHRVVQVDRWGIECFDGLTETAPTVEAIAATKQKLAM